jgi:hypothetical protein
MQSSGRAWVDFSFNILWTVTLVGGCFLLIPPYRAMGYAFALALASVSLAIWQWLMIRRYILKNEDRGLPAVK